MSESKNNPIDNRHVREQLSDYMDGLLPSDEHEAVRAHLEGCSDCRADYVELRATQKLLQAMPAMAAPRSFTLTPEMAGTARKASFWERFFVPQNAPRLATGSVVAFLLLFLFVTGDFLGNNGPAAEQLAIVSTGASSQEQPSQYNSSAKAAATNTTAAAAAPSEEGFGGGSSAAAAPTSTVGAAGPQAGVHPEPTPAEPSAGGSTDQTVPDTSSGGDATNQTIPIITPNTEVGNSGTGSPTTTTSGLVPAPPSSDGTISNDKLAVSPPPPADNRTHTAPTTDNRTGWVALQLGLLALGLALGVAAFIAWRRT